MSTVRQLSFSSGEISPSLYSRVDLVKYSTGVRTARNMLVQRQGGLANRPGTEFICEVKDSTKSIRLIQFIFNSSQTYMLEFGDLYMRVMRDGVQVTDADMTITAVTNANPAVVTYSGADPSLFANGQEVYISGIVGPIGTYLNNRNFKVANVNTGANTFSLQYMDGTAVNSTSFGAYTSGGTASRVYEIISPYIEADLPDLKFVQSADVITIVHPNYAPRELARTGHTSWSFSVITFAPGQAAPTGLGGLGAGAFDYQVTATAAETFEESLPSTTYTARAIGTLTWVAAANAIEYTIYKSSNGVFGFIGTARGTSFVDTGFTPITTATPPDARNPFTNYNISGITQANPAVVTSTAHGFINGDTIFISSVVGMTQVNNLSFTVAGVTANTFQLSGVNSTGYTAYSSGGNALKEGYGPSTVSYYQQRLIFGNTDLDPEKVWTSRTGQFTNFTTSSPLQNDDAITFTLAGRQVNSVKHILDLGRLLVLTAGGEWAIQGDAAGVITPTDINAKQYSYNGSFDLSPLIVNENALYIQARGTIIRDLGFDYQVDGYRGNDLTIFSAHLFDNYSILDWTYQQVPNSIVWAVRDDGTLLGLTYIREHQVFGWHRHNFQGDTAENVSCIPEGNEDFIYLCINRTINGSTKRYIERMTTRQIIDVIDNQFMDSYLTYDGRNTGATTMTLSGSGWTYTDTLTLTRSVSGFTASDVGNQIFLTGSDGTVIRFTIDGFTSGTVVTGRPHMDVPVVMQAAAITTWTRAVDEIQGLWHLEGKSVSVFADRFVVASPNNASYDVITVTNGSITLDKPYGVIHVGLPTISDVQTLDVDSPQGETISDKKKIVSRVSAFVQDTRGVWTGAKPPADDDTDPLEGLSELKIRNSETYDEPVNLTTDSVEINIQPEWNSNGRVFIRQVDPTPMTILSVAPAGLFPFRNGGQ